MPMSLNPQCTGKHRYNLLGNEFQLTFCTFTALFSNLLASFTLKKKAKFEIMMPSKLLTIYPYAISQLPKRNMGV